jgi:hypothetical protein
MLHNVLGSDFEAVDDSVFMVTQNSAQARSCDLNGDGVVVDIQRVVAASLGSPCRIGP